MRAKVMAVCLIVAGCQTAAPPPPAPAPLPQPRNQQEWCAQAIHALANPAGDPLMRQLLAERIRNEGCLGQRRPYQVQVR